MSSRADPTGEPPARRVPAAPGPPSSRRPSSLFVERGYAATTIEAISDRSDTPQATVYRLFSSKLGILKALLDVSDRR